MQAPIILLAFANESVQSEGRLRNLVLEHSSIRDALLPAEKQGLCKLIERPNATIDEIRQVFKEYPNQVAVFHYGGHASSNQLLLNTSDKQNTASAHSAGLVSFLGDRKGLQLVYLNGCSTKKISLDLVEQNSCCVVGTSNSVNDEVARKVALEFYKSFALGYDVNQSWRDAQSAITTVHGTASMRSFTWEGMDFDDSSEEILWNLYGDISLNWKLQKPEELTAQSKETIVHNYVIGSLDYQKLASDIQDINDILANIPEDKVNLRTRQLEKLKELHAQEEELKNMVFGLHETFTRINLNTKRLMQAKAHFDKGEFREADSILNAETMEQDLEKAIAQEEEAEKLLLEAKEMRNNLLEEYLVKAKLWQTFYNEPDWEVKTIGFYEKALEANRNVNTLSEYAFFLQNQRYPEKAGKAYQEILDIYRKMAETNPAVYKSKLGWTLSNLAALHASMGLQKIAEKEYFEALAIRRELAETNPTLYLNDLAWTLNNLAVLHAGLNSIELATQEYTEALAIRRQLANENPALYSENLATTLSNLALLHDRNGLKEKAEAMYKESLAIRRELAATNPNKHLPSLGFTLNNLAVMHANSNRLELAEQAYSEALQIRRELAKQNPRVYLPDLAWTLNAIGTFHGNTQRFEVGESKLWEALEIRRGLAEKNPTMYLADLATTLTNLGYFYLNENLLNKAEEMYLEALEIRRQLATGNYSKYMPDVGLILNNLGAIYVNQDMQKAEKNYNDALKIRKELAEKNPRYYLPDVIWTLNNLANLYDSVNLTDLANEKRAEVATLTSKLENL